MDTGDFMGPIKFSLFTIITLFSSTNLLAENICSIEKMVGDVKAKSDGIIREVHSQDSFSEGTYLKTGENSFIRLVFIDKSTITLGSNSIIKIAKFNRTESGIINVLRGQMRAKVSKSYMDIDDKEKSKLFIRTKTAAMGVRGTDFEVDFDEETNHTTLLTFEGKVAINALDEKNSRRELNQDELEKVLNRKDRAMVTRGFISEHRQEIKKIEPKKMEVKLLEKFDQRDVPHESIKEISKLSPGQDLPKSKLEEKIIKTAPKDDQIKNEFPDENIIPIPKEKPELENSIKDEKIKEKKEIPPRQIEKLPPKEERQTKPASDILKK